MSASTTTPVATAIDSQPVACVRYGFPPESDRPRQLPELHRIDAAIPEGASTASPIYMLSPEQYERHEDFENPYKVKEAKSIATAFQNECEDAGRVAYPVYVESDAFPETPFEAMSQSISAFVKEELDCPLGDCRFYFSGRRSVHAHVPRVVTSEGDLRYLKERARKFCSDNSAEFDLGIYSLKRQFRLPGVRHHKTNLPKVEIDPEWDHDRIVKQAGTTTPSRPATFAELLRGTFPAWSSKAPQQSLAASQVSFTERDDSIEVPVIEQLDYPGNSDNVKRWAQYRDDEFSPYAHTDAGRSVAALKVKGGAFAQRKRRDGATMVPAKFYGARSPTGEYTKELEHAPLQLSDPDYAKWKFHSGDHVVVIGGRSRQSRLLSVDYVDAMAVGFRLVGDDGSRQEALSYLEGEGYDVGEAGSTTGDSSTGSLERPGEEYRIPPVRTPTTEAAQFQQQAEQHSIENLTHDERFRVATRLLWYGWDPAWRWFQRQYGDAFKPDVTHQQFESIVQSYPHDFDHIEVPSSPG